jgi:hypothetical protein
MQLIGLKGILFPIYRPENYDFNSTKSIFWKHGHNSPDFKKKEDPFKNVQSIITLMSSV